VVGANSNTIRGLSIVNSGNLAISFNSSSTDSTADCLYLGMEADGTTANSAGKSFGLSAIQVEGASNTTLNNNLISGNDSTEFTDGIRIVSNASGVNITGNIIGLDETGTLIRGNGDRGIITTGTPSNIVIGGLTAETRNIVSGNAFDGIRFRTLTSGATVLGNYIGLSWDGNSALGNGRHGISAEEDTSNIQIGDGTPSGSNRIFHNAGDGVSVTENSQTSVIANSIFSNTGLGIDINNDDVSANDAGDVDSGPNDLLNFPVINSVGANGSTNLDYDITLDVPANTPGYRIDFFKNTSADPTGFGEGEIYLGAIDVSGSGNHTGTFTAGVIF